MVAGFFVIMDGDGIWDTTAVIVGMRSDVPDQWGEFDQLLDHFDDIIDDRPMDYQSTNMTVTGLTKTLEDVSDAIYDDLVKMMPYCRISPCKLISNNLIVDLSVEFITALDGKFQSSHEVSLILICIAEVDSTLVQVRSHADHGCERLVLSVL